MEVDCQHTGTYMYVCSSVTDIGTVMQVAKGCTNKRGHKRMENS